MQSHNLDQWQITLASLNVLPPLKSHINVLIVLCREGLSSTRRAEGTAMIRLTFPHTARGSPFSSPRRMNIHPASSLLWISLSELSNMFDSFEGYELDSY